jgi:hypothetical protein
MPAMSRLREGVRHGPRNRMRGEVLQDKRAEGRAGRAVATWNTRRLPTRMTPG